MRVLMISLDGSLLGDPHGDTVQRHLAYARRIGQLAIVVYNPASSHQTTRYFSDELSVHPTNASSPYLYPWKAYHVAARLQREQSFDVVTTQGIFATGLVGTLLKRRFGLPLNMQSHSTFLTNPHWIRERPVRNRLLRFLGKLLIKQADTHRVLTEHEKQVYCDLDVDAARIMVQTVPVKLDLFTAPVPAEAVANLRHSFQIAVDAPVVLWVGTPAPVKNVGLLLDAFEIVHQQHPAARLVLAGDFTSQPQYVQRANPDTVRFAGRVAHVDLPVYYALATLYAHSSRYEGVPRVMIEALAAGKPVVSTRHIGSSAVVRDGETGLLCEHTPASLAGVILELLTDPARAHAMGQAGRADVQQWFDYEQQMNGIVETYQITRDIAGQTPRA